MFLSGGLCAKVCPGVHKLLLANRRGRTAFASVLGANAKVKLSHA